MITLRRTYQAKIGQANSVVARMRAFREEFIRYGGPPFRIYTDFHSGASDRVVLEYDFDSLTAMELQMAALFQSSEYREAHEAYVETIKELLVSATTEMWRREDEAGG